MTKRTNLLLALLTTVLLTVTAEKNPGAVNTAQHSRLWYENIAASAAHTVCCIAQDSSRVIWMGTEKGLYTYDGYNCYPHRLADDEANSRIHCLLIHEGRLYAGSERGLLVFSLLTERYETATAMGPADIRALALDSDGRGLLLGAADGVYRYDLKDGNLHLVGQTASAVYALLPLRQGFVAGTINGLMVYDRWGHSKTLRLVDGRQPLVNALLYDKGRQTYWIGTEGRLYSSHDLQTFTEHTALRGNSVKSLRMLSDGRLFIGTDDGLYVLHSDGRTEHSIHDSRNPESLANNIVWTLFADNYDHLFAGTDNGLSIYVGETFYTTHNIYDITRQGDGNCLHAILKGSDGRIWVGGTNGVIVYRPTPGGYDEVVWYKQTSSTHPLSHNRVRKIYEDRDGDIWVATDHGINRVNPVTGQMENYIVTDATGRYTCNWAYDMVHDTAGRLWIAAYMGGIFVVDKQRLIAHQTKAIEADRHIGAEKGGLAGIHVGQLAIDRRGYVWALIQKRGLDCINPKDWSVRHTGIGDYNYLLADSREGVWVAADHGVTHYGSSDDEGSERTFEGLSQADKIESLCETRDGLWAVSSSLAFVVRGDGRTACMRLPSTGILTAFAKKDESMVYTGGNDQLTEIVLGGIDAETAGMGVTLTRLMVNGENYQPEEQSIGRMAAITLPHDRNNLTFMMSDLPFLNKPQHLYAYRLEGHEKWWSYVPINTGAINYNGLKPGRYRLVVKAVGSDDELYALSVRILHPWYLSWWACLIYVLLAVAFMAWVLRYVLLHRQMRRMQAERRQMLEQSAQRTHFFDELSGQLKLPLGRIMASIFQLMPGENDLERYHRMNGIRQDSQRMNKIIHEMIDFDLATPNLVSQRMAESIDVVDFCRKLVEDLRQSDAYSQVDVVMSTGEEHIIMMADATRLHYITGVLLQYVANHTKKGSQLSFTIDTDKPQAVIRMTVASEGLYIPEEQHALAFLRYTTADDASHSGLSTTANGQNMLYGVRHYVEAANGSIVIENTADGASRFVVVFPYDASIQHPSPSHPLTPSLPKVVLEDDHKALYMVVKHQESADERLLNEATIAIEQHLSDSDYNVTRLQEELGVGNKLLYRKVKQLIGMTPVEYIRDIRIKRAALLLREGKFSVSEVMYMVGFSNSGYFSKCFQKIIGALPTEYMKR